MLNSDHRLMELEVDCSRWLGVTARRQRLPKPEARIRESMLYLNDDEKVMRYKLRAMDECEGRGIWRKAAAVRAAVQERMARGVEFRVDEEVLQQLMDVLDISFWSMLKEVKDEVAGRMKT